MYAMRGIKTPIGVATYSTEIIEEIKEALPAWAAWDEAHPLAIDERKYSKRALELIEYVTEDPTIKRERLAERMNVSLSTVARLLRNELKGVVYYVGGSKDGRWIVKEN